MHPVLPDKLDELKHRLRNELRRRGMICGDSRGRQTVDESQDSLQPTAHFEGKLNAVILFPDPILLMTPLYKYNLKLLPQNARQSLRQWANTAILLILIALPGCSTAHYKQAADKEVYQIIDQKWQPEFGSKANFKVSDVPPDPEDIKDETEVPPKGKVTLAQAAAIAISRNRDYKTQQENLYLAALNLTLERHRFAPQFSGGLAGTLNRSTTRTQIPTQAGTVVNKDETRKSLAAEGDIGAQWLGPDGTQISGLLSVDWLRFLTGDPQEALGAILSGSITQPLLRGAGRLVVMENLTQAERNTLYQIRSFNRFRKTFLVSIITSYYRVLQAQNAANNAVSNHDMLVASVERAKMLADAGRLPQFEVDQAEQDRLTAWDNVVRTRRQYQQALDEFKLRLGLPTDCPLELDPAELQRLEKQGTTDPQYSLEDAIKIALTRRLDLANLRDAVEDARRKIAVAENGLLPDLNLAAEGTAVASDHLRLGQQEIKHGAYAVSPRIDLPLERQAERNAYRQSLISLLQRQRQYEQGQDQIKLEVRQAYRNLKETANIYGIQQKSLILAQKRVENTTLLLEAGRVTTRDLLDSQAALLGAQNARVGALVDHTIALLNFYTDVEVLHVQPDGFWRLEDEPKPQ